MASNIVSIDIPFYVVSAVLVFLIIVLFALVINLYMQIKELKNKSHEEEEDDDGVVTRQAGKPSDFTLAKPMLSQSWQAFPPVNADKLERQHNQNHRNDDNFSSINFNERMPTDNKPFKPQAHAQGQNSAGAYKNPLYGNQSQTDLDERYDYVENRNSEIPRALPGFAQGPNQGRDFRPPASNNYNQSNNDYTFPKREYQRGNNSNNYY